jgi:outer membrane protein OmpA-like peptidoglycan-associated protein
MKKILFFNMLMLIASISINAQTLTDNHKGFQISARGGFDALPMYENNTPNIDYKGNWMAGITANYYFKRWLGAGLDGDFLVNNPKSTYPTNSLFYNVIPGSSGVPITTLQLDEKYIARTFVGIGPSFRYLKSNKWNVELNLRGGVSTIKGGQTSLVATVPITGNSLNANLNFHSGYDSKMVLSSKVAVQFNYFITKNVGVNIGVYHLNHFNTPELRDPASGFSSGYNPFAATASGYDVSAKPILSEPLNHNVSSVGAYAGIVIRFPQKSTDKTAKKQKEPKEVKVAGCKLNVTARDKYTKEILPETNIALVNESGQIVNTGKTDNFGLAVFDKVPAGNYTIKGSLNAINLEEIKVPQSDFKDCMKSGGGIVQKEILYADRNFIIKGRAFECNSTTPIAGINVTLENKDLAVKKSTVTDAQGNFLLQLPETGEYDLYGKMEKYFSQIEKVSANDYKRDKNLFVKLEMCAEKAECGTALGLRNILFDLDKFEIKETAKVELNRLVLFMNSNPKVKVEVGSHTDCRSSNEYNNTLSQNRANASVNYIVSQGVERSRITGKGYGESILLNGCSDGVTCSEAQHSVNRRTEMKVICPE